MEVSRMALTSSTRLAVEAQVSVGALTTRQPEIVHPAHVVHLATPLTALAQQAHCVAGMVAKLEGTGHAVATLSPSLARQLAQQVFRRLLRSTTAGFRCFTSVRRSDVHNAINEFE